MPHRPAVPTAVRAVSVIVASVVALGLLNPAAASAAAWPAANTSLEAQVVTLVNRERARAGCPPLAVDSRLRGAARTHSLDMARRGYFSHTSPTGVTFDARITRTGYRWSAAGENIAGGQRTAAQVMTAWMRSPGHRANILNCGFRQIGVGVVVSATSRYSPLWTQDFGTPR